MEKALLYIYHLSVYLSLCCSKQSERNDLSDNLSVSGMIPRYCELHVFSDEIICDTLKKNQLV